MDEILDSIKKLEAEVNRLNDKLNGVTLLNTVLAICLADKSPAFVQMMEHTIDELVASKHKLPGDFEAQARQIVSAVLLRTGTEPEPLRPTSIFQVLQGGLSNQSE